MLYRSFASIAASLRCVCLATLAIAAPVAQAKDAPEPVPVDAGFRVDDQASRLFTVAQGQALKGVRRVAVPLFTVDFVTADSETAQTSGFAAAGRARATSYYRLKGIDQAAFQQLTDAALARFTADLQSAGFEVVPAERIQAAASYRKLVAGKRGTPIVRDDGMTMAPAGMAIYGFSEVASGGAKPGLFGGLSAMSSAFSAVGSAVDTVELARELDAAVVEVQLRVHFVELTNGNKGFLGRMASTASVGARVYPSIASAMFSVQSSTRGSLTLKQPLALDAGAFSQVRKAPTTAADVAGGIAVGLLSLASGSKDTNSTEEMEAVADPARYRDITGGGIAVVNRMFVQRLRAGE